MAAVDPADVDDLLSQATSPTEQIVALITTMAKAYTRGNGFDGDGGRWVHRMDAGRAIRLESLPHPGDVGTPGLASPPDGGSPKTAFPRRAYVRQPPERPRQRGWLLRSAAGAVGGLRHRQTCTHTAHLGMHLTVDRDGNHSPYPMPATTRPPSPVRRPSAVVPAHPSLPNATNVLTSGVTTLPTQQTRQRPDNKIRLTGQLIRPVGGLPFPAYRLVQLLERVVQLFA
jgi:hypothetical protein